MSHLFQRLASSATQPAAPLKLRPLSGSIYAPPRQFLAEDAGINLGEERADAVAPRQSPTSARGAGQLLPSIRDEDRGAASPKSANASSFISATSRLDDVASSNPTATPHVQDRNLNRPPWFAAGSPLADQSGRIASGEQGAGRARAVEDGPRREPLLPAAGSAPVPLSTAQLSSSAPVAARVAPLLPARMPGAAATRAGTPQPSHGAASPGSDGDEIHIHIGRVEVAAVSPPPARPAPAAASRKSLNLEEYLRRGNRRNG